MDNLWVIIVLLFVGGAIVTVRLFRNGALDETGPPAPKTRAPARYPGPEPAAASPAWFIPSATPASPQSASAAWPGGYCPACGSLTVRFANFCGECGHRLTP